jgi:hypothetical protein
MFINQYIYKEDEDSAFNNAHLQNFKRLVLQKNKVLFDSQEALNNVYLIKNGEINVN